jgi:hypothetical protein
VALKEVIGAVAARNRNSDWTFQRAALAQLSDDFLLLLQYMSCYDGEDLQGVCNRWGNFFLTEVEQNELKAIEDEGEIIRPIWLFFVALCYSLQEGEEHDLTGYRCMLAWADR